MWIWLGIYLLMALVVIAIIKVTTDELMWTWVLPFVAGAILVILIPGSIWVGIVYIISLVGPVVHWRLIKALRRRSEKRHYLRTVGFPL